MTVIEQERDIIQQLIPQLEEEGYAVYIEPSSQLLPAFLKGFRPDAIAIGSKSKRNLAIEVLVEGSFSQKKQDRLIKSFEGVDDWELRTFFVRPVTQKAGLPSVSIGAIEKAIDDIYTLVATRSMKPALLMSWATFEALGRNILPEKFALAQTPGRLIEVLAGEGYITPDEADVLRRLALQRNALIHGGLDTTIEERDVIDFLGLLKNLISLPH